MRTRWRWWCLASLTVHLAVASVAVETFPARRSPPRASVTLELQVLPPSRASREEPGAEGPGPVDPTVTGPASPRPEGRLGGARSAQNISADTPGERGDGRSLERGQLLAARADGVNLESRLLNTLAQTQEQRIRTARTRASPQDDRRTPNPSDDPWLATGAGILLFRARPSPSVPTLGASTSPGPGRAPGSAPPLVTDGVAVRPPPAVSPGGRPRVSAGIADALHGRSHRTAGPVATGRPPLEQGHASTRADALAERPSDNQDAALLAASLIRAHVNATVQEGSRRAEGQGGVGGGGAPGSGGGVGRGGRAQALGDGEGWLSLTSSDPRYIGYFHEVSRRLYPLWANAFPREEALQLRQGTVILRFVIARDGSVQGVRIDRRSGVAAFDDNVRAAVASAHLPPIPSGLGASELRVRAPFQFRNPIVR